MSDAYNDALDRFLFDTMRVKEELDSNAEFVEEYLKIRYKQPAWRTREGKLIPIYKMENGHLKNVIRYLEIKNKDDFKEWINAFKCELKFREIGRQERILERKHAFYTEIIAIL